MDRKHISILAMGELQKPCQKIAYRTVGNESGLFPYDPAILLFPE